MFLETNERTIHVSLHVYLMFHNQKIHEAFYCMGTFVDTAALCKRRRTDSIGYGRIMVKWHSSYKIRERLQIKNQTYCEIKLR